jgi:hypothetical protein
MSPNRVEAISAVCIKVFRLNRIGYFGPESRHGHTCELSTLRESHATKNRSSVAFVLELGDQAIRL